MSTAISAATDTIHTWLANLPDQLDDLAPEIIDAIDVIAHGANDIDELTRIAALGALFIKIIEWCNDRFQPHLRAASDRVMSRISWCCREYAPPFKEHLEQCRITSDQDLWRRQRRNASTSHTLVTEPQRIAIFSRVTIGADVLLTSVVLQHLRERWPKAELVIFGDPKLSGLFGGCPNVRVEPVRYVRRGQLAERIASALMIDELLSKQNIDLIVNPDSRLDQLGLVPFTTTAPMALWNPAVPAVELSTSLATAVDKWACQRFGTTFGVQPQLWLDQATTRAAQQWHAAIGSDVIAVKLDHGGNPAKALPHNVELQVLQQLRDHGWRILIDRGFGAEEEASSDALMQQLGWTPVDVHDSGKGDVAVADLAAGQLAEHAVIRFHGSIAGWAAALSACSAAFSYDSVGHHLAAALGVPLTTAFRGYPNDRFVTAWQPQGHAPVSTIRCQDPLKNGIVSDIIDAIGAPCSQAP